MISALPYKTPSFQQAKNGLVSEAELVDVTFKLEDISDVRCKQESHMSRI